VQADQAARNSNWLQRPKGAASNEPRVATKELPWVIPAFENFPLLGELNQRKLRFHKITMGNPLCLRSIDRSVDCYISRSSSELN